MIRGKHAPQAPFALFPSSWTIYRGPRGTGRKRPCLFSEERGVFSRRIWNGLIGLGIGNWERKRPREENKFILRFVVLLERETMTARIPLGTRTACVSARAPRCARFAGDFFSFCVRLLFLGLRYRASGVEKIGRAGEQPKIECFMLYAQQGGVIVAARVQQQGCVWGKVPLSRR